MTIMVAQCRKLVNVNHLIIYINHCQYHLKQALCLHLTQNGTEDLELAVDTFLENGTWESFDPDSLSGEPILRVRNPQICARVL